MFGTLLSVILSLIFLVSLLAGIGYYFNLIFIQRPQYIALMEDKVFSQTDLISYNLPQAAPIFNMNLTVLLPFLS